MVTRLLHACGLHLGPKNELMPPQADNPDGFWEHLGFVALNDELLSQLGGAWDLPPTPPENFADSRLDPLRMKARLLIERFASATVWGWKDPRNSLTLPFWQDLQPGLKTIIVVRNPLEVAQSMRKRNGTSYSFGLRLWEIYNRRVIEATEGKERLVTHYDLFFEDAALELKQIARFAGLPDSQVEHAAALVTKRRRHTRFTLGQLVDAGVAAEVIDLYRGLLVETTRAKSNKEAAAKAQQPTKAAEPDFLPGAISRLNAFVPDTVAQIEQVYGELLAQAEARHRTESEQLSTHYKREIEQLRDRITEINELLHERSATLAESESRVDDLRDRLCRQLKTTKRLLQLLDETQEAAARLRSSARWQIANPVSALKTKVSPSRSRELLGYGHLEKVVSSYQKWRAGHAEVAAIDDQIRALISGTVVASAQRAAPIEPPVPTRPIEFPVHDLVDVSIIIPVFNQFRFTQACLASIQQHHCSRRFEVIVVDDCSTDESAEALPCIPGIVYLRNETNLGFVASCNRGAEKARGKYLLLLNNDTLVEEGWLSALLDTFAEEPEAGIVGSKLVYPDGRLQEAGGIIWRDGSGWNYGKFQDARRPEYNFLREVDYCSAAALMIPKALFKEVGAFDTRYSPAYYEDTDLAFKVRNKGHRVLYQPRSQVIHYEGATGGTDLSTGAKKHQEINRSGFAERWAAELMHKPEVGNIVLAQQSPPRCKNILVIDQYVPTPDRDSGSLRMFQILKLLHQLGHHITFIPDNLAKSEPYTGELQKRGIEVQYHPYIKSVREYLSVHGARFDVVILSRRDFARKHVEHVRIHAPQSRVIFDTVDLHFLREDRHASLTNDPEVLRQAEGKQDLELKLINEADETWVVSEVEQQLLQAMRPTKSIQVVSNIVDVPGSTGPFASRRDWLFIGSFEHTPNVDAMIFFLREIYPLVQSRLKDAKFYIIGQKVPPEVVTLATENVVITGVQPEVRPFFENARLSVAPLRYGAGVKGKINQSMGFGVPVVATSLAVEGMNLQPRQDVLVADTPTEFAEAVVELYESEELWTRVSENGIRKTRALYSTDAARKKLQVLFSDEHLKGVAQSATAEQTEIAIAART
jgi:GT2 family glycosyltransferase/glycosyltransferase involved in cell wall biosynthesis